MVNIGTPALPNRQPVGGNGNGNGWSLTGNGNTNPSNNFIGTTNNQPLRLRGEQHPGGTIDPVTRNISWGLHAGQANTAGFNNIAIGT